jgi:phenylalanyl-tRNA synthetase beta chain
MGYVGEISPRVREELDLPPFFLFELDFDAIVHYARPDFKVRPIPRFPSVERDLAIVVAEDFPSQTVIDWVKGLDRALIERVDIFDEYTGAPISEGRKSLAYKVFYRSMERTLTDQEVNAVHEDLTRQLCAAFDATLR